MIRSNGWPLVDGGNVNEIQGDKARRINKVDPRRLGSWQTCPTPMFIDDLHSVKQVGCLYLPPPTSSLRFSQDHV